MALDKAVLQYDHPAAAQFINFTDAEFGGGTPELVLIFQSGHNPANDAGDTPNCRLSFGAYDGTLAAAAGTTSLDNVAATDVYKVPVGTGAIDNESPGGGNFYSVTAENFVADGVRLRTFTANVGRGTMVFLGGSDFQCLVGEIALGTGTTAITTTIGFEADAVLFFSTCSGGADQNLFGAAIGMATKDGTQKCVSWAEADAIAAGGQPSQVFLSNRCMAQQSPTASTQDWTLTFGNVTSTTFDVTPSASAGSDTVGYVAMKFTGKAVKLWEFTTPTSTGQVADTTPGFSVGLGIVVGTNLDAADTGQFNDNLAGGLGIGAFTASSKSALSWYIDSTADPTNTGSDAKTKALQIGNGTGSAGVVADLVSMNSDGWTLDYTAVQANAKQCFAFAVEGDAIAATWVPRVIHY